MNIEILAGKCRGYDCANCLKETTKGEMGFRLIVREAKVKMAGIKVGTIGVDEDLCAPCGLALHKSLTDELAKSPVAPCPHCKIAKRTKCLYCREPICSCALGTVDHGEKCAPFKSAAGA